ncbi:hypothetical protein [Undibacterium sp. Ji22W]|uniref:hypothetical protein n=1 Tax=Undibacterium sp. Ji22W TaxID=3413038 RepID=UPI003BF2816F
MSDNWLQYVPKDPSFQPSPSAAATAELLLRAWLPELESVESKFHEEVTFFKGGANFSGSHCPACEANTESWWADAIEAAAQTGFTNLNCVASCCGASVSLNELKYDWPAGFASYSLAAMNPKVGDSRRCRLLGWSKN